MKLLVDMNLSPTWVEALHAMGFEAVHWSTVGDPRASDRELLEHARAAGYTVFTNDPDLDAILAASAASSPSVIQVRATDLSPARLGPLRRAHSVSIGSSWRRAPSSRSRWLVSGLASCH